MRSSDVHRARSARTPLGPRSESSACSTITDASSSGVKYTGGVLPGRKRLWASANSRDTTMRNGGVEFAPRFWRGVPHRNHRGCVLHNRRHANSAERPRRRLSGWRLGRRSLAGGDRTEVTINDAPESRPHRTRRPGRESRCSAGSSPATRPAIHRHALPRDVRPHPRSARRPESRAAGSERG